MTASSSQRSRNQCFTILHSPVVVDDVVTEVVEVVTEVVVTDVLVVIDVVDEVLDVAVVVVVFDEVVVADVVIVVVAVLDVVVVRVAVVALVVVVVDDTTVVPFIWKFNLDMCCNYIGSIRYEMITFGSKCPNSDRCHNCTKENRT